MVDWPGYGEWSWISMGIMMLLFWIPVVAVIAWVLSPRGGVGRAAASIEISAREILDRRYARGEITQEQYKAMVADLEQSKK